MLPSVDRDGSRSRRSARSSILPGLHLNRRREDSAGARKCRLGYRPPCQSWQQGCSAPAVARAVPCGHHSRTGQQSRELELHSARCSRKRVANITPAPTARAQPAPPGSGTAASEPLLTCARGCTYTRMNTLPRVCLDSKPIPSRQWLAAEEYPGGSQGLHNDQPSCLPLGTRARTAAGPAQQDAHLMSIDLPPQQTFDPFKGKGVRPAAAAAAAAACKASCSSMPTFSRSAHPAAVPPGAGVWPPTPPAPPMAPSSA